MSIFVKQLRRNITGRESGSNKQSASKSCALSLVRQLYHLGVIEAFSGTLKKPKTEDNLAPYDVKVNPELIAKAQDALNGMNIKPVRVNSMNSTENSVSLLVPEPVVQRKPQPFQDTGNIIAWSPPIPNWNAWNASNIDEGYLATATLEQLSDDLMANAQDKKQNDRTLDDRSRDRETLPIHAMRRTIMEAVNDNSVVLIRGNTGCGEFIIVATTLQLSQIILYYSRKNNSNRTIHLGRLHLQRSRCVVQHCRHTAKTHFSDFSLRTNRSRKK
jgi:ATP-dependent RNA helicase A